jgi:hypothetical protein
MADFFLVGQQEARKTIGRGVNGLFCPFCRQHQKCKAKELGLYVSWFFIPLKRVAVLTKYYKCTKCQKRFPAFAPDWETMDQRVAMDFLMLSCMIRVRMANGAFRKQPEGVAVGQQFLIFAHAAVGEADLVERAVYMKKVTGENGLEEDLIPMVYEKLNLEQREHVLRAMSAVTLSEGNVNAREAKVIVQVGKILGLPDNTVAQHLNNKK